MAAAFKLDYQVVTQNTIINSDGEITCPKESGITSNVIGYSIANLITGKVDLDTITKLSKIHRDCIINKIGVGLGYEYLSSR